MKTWKPLELEAVPCDCCGSSEITREYLRGDNLRVVECLSCGLAYLNPRPRADLIPRFYSEEYFDGTAAARGEGGLTLVLSDNDAQASEQYATPPRPIALINSEFGGLRDKRVLEVGCATGDLLRKIKRAGADVSGLEISEFAAKIARSRQLAVETGSIESYVSRFERTFDFVIALEVIEHVLSPNSFIDCAAKLVRPGGYLVLSTPNYACAKRFGEKWLGFNASYEHLYFFSVPLLKLMAMKHRFFLKYWETSRSFEGPGSDKYVLDRQFERLKDLKYLVGEIGPARIMADLVARARDRWAGRSSAVRPYGAGHSLLAVFERR